MSNSGIYKIQSIIKPERIYIGSAVNISHRWDCHLSDLKLNKHGNSKLQNHYNKYGIADVQFSILLMCNKEDLIKVEQYFIDSYNSYFNINKIAGSRLGMKHSDETKIKLSKVNKGRKQSLEAKRKQIESQKGKKCSDETKKKISLANKGKKYPYIKERMIGNTIWKGRKHTEETLNKMRGRRKSDEEKRKLSEANKGKVLSEDTIKKIRLSHLGMKQSPETIAKRINKCIGKKRTKEQCEKMRIAWINRKLKKIA